MFISVIFTLSSAKFLILIWKKFKNAPHSIQNFGRSFSKILHFIVKFTFKEKSASMCEFYHNNMDLFYNSIGKEMTVVLNWIELNVICLWICFFLFALLIENKWSFRTFCVNKSGLFHTYLPNSPNFQLDLNLSPFELSIWVTASV